jgi:hypothetical protein
LDSFLATTVFPGHNIFWGGAWTERPEVASCVYSVLASTQCSHYFLG